ncbi:MAG: metal-dependent hydrolase, partial [Gammaproteobacteria bacterium HGW-Gammaproteobacteria-14]
FIDSVRQYQKSLSDPDLLTDVRRFIGQEAHHGQEHEAFNLWLEEKGYPIAPVLQQIQQGLEQARKRLNPRQQLAMTLALEHFTAIMADQFLTNPELSEPIHPEVRALFSWHAMEETEHKAVAYDVYQATGGGYWTRVLMMVQITLLFWLHILTITRAYLKSEGQGGIGQMARGVWWLIGKPGPLRQLIPDYLDYFRPAFHPWQHDNRELIRPLQEALSDRVIN